jgi:hypothetical protein
LLVEDGAPLGQVCHYIHLNPVRAGLVSPAHLPEFRFSSYWYLRRPTARPACLGLGAALEEAGGLTDTPAGWRCYGDYLAWQAAEGPAGRNAAYVSLSRGWALGGAGFKAALVKDHALAAHARAWETHGAREVSEMRWEETLANTLRALGRNESDAAEAAKSAPWKLAVAAWLKAHTQASNGWLSRRLRLGAPAALSRNLTHFRRHRQDQDPTWKALISKSAT